jgi:hypothetical protein
MGLLDPRVTVKKKTAHLAPHKSNYAEMQNLQHHQNTFRIGGSVGDGGWEGGVIESHTRALSVWCRGGGHAEFSPQITVCLFGFYFGLFLLSWSDHLLKF